jgi:hypothetical protein
MSRSPQPVEGNYAITERESLAVIGAFASHTVVDDANFLPQTDHSALQCGSSSSTG